MSDGKWLKTPIRRRLKDGTLIENEAIIHLCSVPSCNRFAPHLIGANWLTDIRGTAYCREHLPENETLTFRQQNAPKTNSEAPDATEPDGPSDLLG
jgi:hypothetical protein